MRIISLIILTLALSSCASGGKKTVDKLYYRFPQALSINKSVDFKISRPTAAGILGNRPMVAQNSDGALLQLNHNFWLESPKVLLQNYLMQSFKPNPNTTGGILYSHILNLEKKGATSLLTITFTLRDNANKIAFEQTYIRQQKLVQNTMPTFVKSIFSSLDSIITQLAEDLK